MHRRALPILAICSVMLVALIAPSQASAAWQLRYYGRFSHGLNTSMWTRYSGTPRCCPDTVWKQSHVVVKGGILRLQNYRDPAYGGRWVSGGISMGRSLNQTYGRYRVRFRITKGRGVGMCIFLWPQARLAARGRLRRGVIRRRRAPLGDLDAALRLAQQRDPPPRARALHASGTRSA